MSLIGRGWQYARRALLTAGVVLPGMCVPVATPAQTLRKVVDQPRIASLRIDGNASISTTELLAAMVTEPSHARRFLGVPIPFLRVNRTLDRAELDRDLLRLRVLYWKRGWRSAQVTPVFDKRDAGVIDLTLKIAEGPPTLIGRLNLGPLDSLLEAHDLRPLVTVHTGEPLDLIHLDSIAVRIAAHLDEEGFGDLTVSPVAVADTSSPLATVTMQVNRLYQTRVESVRVEGTEKYDPRLVANTMRVKAGDTYSRVGVIESQRALYEAGFFKRAFVRVEPGSSDSLKRLIALVEELPTRSFRVTGGVSTVDFFQVDARYLNANFRSSAGRLTVQGTIGNILAPQLDGKLLFNKLTADTVVSNTPRYLEPTFQLNVDLRRRWLKDSRNQTGLSLFGYRRSVPGVFVDQGGGAGASFTRNVTRAIPVSLRYSLEFTNVGASDEYYCVSYGVCDTESLRVLRGTQRLAPISLTASRDLRDDPIGPTRGSTWRAELEFADTWTGSQFGYARLELEGSKYFHMSDKLTIAVHGRSGYVIGTTQSLGGANLTPVTVILPRKRFYAGGSRSVRGYGENQLGPRVLVIPRSVFQPEDSVFQRLLADPTKPRLPCPASQALPTCATDSVLVSGRWVSNFRDGDFIPKPLGGEALVEGSIEARYRFWGPLTAAAFLDAGSVGAKFRSTATVITPGIGIRFLSPVGPIRVDLGYNPRSREDLNVITKLDLARDATWMAATNVPTSAVLYQIPNTRSFNPANGTGLGGVFNRLTLHLSIGEAF